MNNSTRTFTSMLLSTMILGALPALGARQSEKSRPNIILLVTDDQDKESIGAYGADVFSPNLDRMAAEGMIFHQAYVSSTVCTPSRYSFLTGRYAGRSYSTMYHEVCPPGQQGFPAFNVELEKDNMNTGAVLQANGYVTGYVGKFHVGPELKRKEHYEKFGLKYIPKNAEESPEIDSAFRFNEKWYRKYLKKRGFSWAKHIYWGNLQKPYNHHNPEWTVEAALEFIEEHRDRPFYLHYCTTLLHGPDKSWRVSMDHPEASGQGRLQELPDVMTDRKELLQRLKNKNLDPYDAHAGNTWVDDSVGAILDKLDELGIAENTLVVFIADHGSNMKASLFDADGTNVPCIMRWPALIKPNSECSGLIQNIDFAPTFFTIADAEVPDEYILDGRNLVPLLKGKSPENWRDHLYFELGFARAVCTGEWKYLAIRYPQEQIEKIKRCSMEQLPRAMSPLQRLGIGTRGALNSNFFEPDQLYNLKDDRFELSNLARNPEYRERLETMREMLKKDLGLSGRPFGEFIPGGNAAAPGQIDKQVEVIKKIKIQGKKISLPENPTPATHSE